MNIIIIGTGNVATVFGRMFLQAGHRIQQVYGRNIEHAGRLAAQFNSAACSEWNEIKQDATLYVAALTDKALSEMAASLRLSGRLIVHTAGSQPMHILKSVSDHYGVLYPLQSIRKEFPPDAGIPFLVDGSDENVKSTLLKLAAEISSVVHETNDEERLKLHVAAVMVNNFTNHLYALAEGFCQDENLDFKLLIPLIQETANRMRRITPAQALTGPAIRNDQSTIDKHLQILNRYPAMKKFYEDFSRGIREFHHK